MISLTGFYNEPVQNRREIARKSYSHRAVPAADHEIARISHGALEASVLRSCGDRRIAMRSSCILGYLGTKTAQHLIFD